MAEVGRPMLQTKMTVGVTGHRSERLGADNLDEIGAAIDRLLMMIEQASSGTNAHARLRLVTSLAEGADAIAADAAVQRGWQLDVVLPFARASYAQDFPVGAARAAYDARLDACEAVMELDGDRNLPGGEGLAYERAGRIVLAQSDVILAVWDGEPAWGRGGAAQIVAEAVIRGIPVIQINPASPETPSLLWDRLHPIDRGQQTVDTVARGDLAALPSLIDRLIAVPDDAVSKARLAAFGKQPNARHWSLAIAYPVMLAVMGVRRLRLNNIVSRFDLAVASQPIRQLCGSDSAFDAKMQSVLAPRFAIADAAATHAAQLFRSVYVTNFALAALAVILSLSSLALPSAKAVLLVLEVVTISTILIQTRTGRRRDWHRQWLDNRALAERLRCLAISAQLGDLDLRNAEEGAAWSNWFIRATARDVGLPSATVNAGYLDCVKASLISLLNDQINYLTVDSHRMHRLEHRLHRLGSWLFSITALACVVMFFLKLLAMRFEWVEELSHELSTAATIIGAALPAIGAAIYGIRMQGDFSGAAARSRELRDHLVAVQELLTSEPVQFDTLASRARRVTGLMTSDVMNWVQTYEAKPLALPG